MAKMAAYCDLTPSLRNHFTMRLHASEITPRAHAMAQRDQRHCLGSVLARSYRQPRTVRVSTRFQLLPLLTLPPARTLPVCCYLLRALYPFVVTSYAHSTRLLLPPARTLPVCCYLLRALYPFVVTSYAHSTRLLLRPTRPLHVCCCLVCELYPFVYILAAVHACNVLE